MLASLTSKLYTVDSLREIADRMGITVPSKARKADIAALIVAGIEDVHAEAIESIATAEANTIDETHDSVSAMTEEYLEWERNLILPDRSEALRRMTNRVNGYMRANGTDKLTPAQWRRIGKKCNRHGINVPYSGLLYV